MPSGWVLADLLTMKINLKCTKSTVLDTLPVVFETVRIRIHIKQLDPDPYQNEKQDPDPYQKGLDPQHWIQLYQSMLEYDNENHVFLAA